MVEIFYKFGQAYNLVKFTYGSLVVGLSQFSLLSQQPQNWPLLQKGQKRLKNNHLRRSKSVTHPLSNAKDDCRGYSHLC